jgi:hypothetical protein
MELRNELGTLLASFNFSQGVFCAVTMSVHLCVIFLSGFPRGSLTWFFVCSENVLVKANCADNFLLRNSLVSQNGEQCLGLLVFPF